MERVGVALAKGPAGLGFTVIDEGNGVLVHSVVPAGAAEGRLVPGDRILAVGEADASALPLRDVVALLKDAPADVVTVVVGRRAGAVLARARDADAHGSAFLPSSAMTSASRGVGSTHACRLHLHPSSPAPIALSAGPGRAIVVAAVTPDAPPGIQPGDVLVAIDGHNLMGASLESACALLQPAPARSVAVVFRRPDDFEPGASAGTPPVASSSLIRSGPAPLSVGRISPIGRSSPALAASPLLARPGLEALKLKNVDVKGCGFTLHRREGFGPWPEASKHQRPVPVFAVTHVMADSPAAEAGLRANDVVLAINDLSLSGLSEECVSALLKKLPASSTASVVVMRASNRAVPPSSSKPSQLARSVTVSRMAAGLGLRLCDRLPEAPATRGVFVEGLAPSAIVDPPGVLAPGDRILAINGQPIAALSFARALELLREVQPAVSLLVAVDEDAEPPALARSRHASIPALPLERHAAPPRRSSSIQRPVPVPPSEVASASPLPPPPPLPVVARGTTARAGKVVPLRIRAQPLALASAFGSTAAPVPHLHDADASIQQLAAADTSSPDYLAAVAASSAPLPKDAAARENGAQAEGVVLVALARGAERDFGVQLVGGAGVGDGVYVSSASVPARARAWEAVQLMRAPQGAAAGSLEIGDRVLWIGGRSTVHSTPEEAMAVFRQAPALASVLAERPGGRAGVVFAEACFHRRPEGLGISISGGTNTTYNGIFVKAVQPGGAAFENGQLRKGDRILAISGASLVGKSHAEAVKAFSQAPREASDMSARLSGEWLTPLRAPAQVVLVVERSTQPPRHAAAGEDRPTPAPRARDMMVVRSAAPALALANPGAGLSSFT